MADSLANSATEKDLYANKLRFHAELVSTAHKIWQGWAEKGVDQESRDWQAAYTMANREFNRQFQNHQGETAEIEAIWKLKKAWLKNNRPTGANAEAVKWEKTWSRLSNCQKEWVAYRAECCTGSTRPVAVPIGCNHRLCPLCAYYRSKAAQTRIKTMYDRLTHPVLVTLTIPNSIDIRKSHFAHMRKRIRQFVADHPRWFKGGVYSLETTFNRKEKTWHLHAHILADSDLPLPTSSQKVDLFGKEEFWFTKIKLEMEFDWLRLWTKGWGKPCRKDVRNQMRLLGDRFDFEGWVRQSRENSTHRRDRQTRRNVRIPGLSDADFDARTQWNAKHRRVIDIRPVTDRDGAAKEVLKYITKSAAFSDLAEAVEPFCNAVRGARLIQTFGTWYGVNLDVPPDPEKPKDWGEMKCTCGGNNWLRMGVFGSSDVAMDDDGRWHLKRPHTHRSRSTMPRPTIRALDSREGDTYDERYFTGDSEEWDRR